MNTPTNSWASVTCSGDGTKVAAADYLSGSVYVSTNSGSSWTTNSSMGTFYSLAMSEDGTELVAISNNAAIYVSTNLAASWNLSFKNFNGNLTQVISSENGRDFFAFATAGGVYVSTNSGASWRTNPSPSVLTSIACSSAAQTLIANFEFNFYMSTNMGLTWINISSRMPATETRLVGCSSADGRIWTILADAGIIVSTNFGATFTLNYFNNAIDVRSIAGSADGKQFLAGQNSNGGLLYTSSDGGATWASTNGSPKLFWTSVASSADGSKKFAVANNSGIWTLQNPPSPQLGLEPRGTNFMLSWIVPATNLVLQESSDLFSWANVTNAPVLNYTNLQDQVELSPVGSCGFFRLVSQ